MSPRQNYIHVTRADLTLRQMVLVTSYRSRWRGKERPRLVYLQSCRSDISQVHVTTGDGMCVRHFVAATCRMNSKWFEFMRQVAASNCIKTYMSHEERVPGTSWGYVTSCNRTLNISRESFNGQCQLLFSARQIYTLKANSHVRRKRNRKHKRKNKYVWTETTQTQTQA